MTESVELIEGNLPTHEVVQEIPTPEENELEAKILCFRLFLAPHQFTLMDLARLQFLLTSLGYNS